jgi:DNA-binding PadR family transcriptional regulator
VPRSETDEAVAHAAPLETARAATGAPPASRAGQSPQAAGDPAGGAGSGDPVAGELRRSGVIALLVLQLLGAEASYGNRLIEGIAELSGGLLAVNPNTMYPLLRSLEDRGLVTSYWEHPERRSRRFYAITAAGEDERERLRSEIAPRLEAVADSVARLRAVLAPPGGADSQRGTAGEGGQ